MPLQLQALEPEFVPHDKHEKRSNGNVIRAGIEFNGIGQRVAYWMYRSHPGDGPEPSAGYNELVRVPAEAVLHVYEPTRPGQLRGVPLLAPVLLRLKTLDDFDDAVLYRQEVANLFAGFIRKPAPEDPPVDPVKVSLRTIGLLVSSPPMSPALPVTTLDHYVKRIYRGVALAGLLVLAATDESLLFLRYHQEERILISLTRKGESLITMPKSPLLTGQWQRLYGQAQAEQTTDGHQIRQHGPELTLWQLTTA